LGGYRTVLGIPLLRERMPIGVIVLTRSQVRPFTKKQIELITTFADQAVIAIENVRLFDEVQARTRELAQSVGELRALGEVMQAVNLTVDLETVLTTIVAKATQLSNTEAGAIYVFDDADREFRLRATYGLDDTVAAELRNRRIRIGEGAISNAVERRMPIQIPDIQNDPSATQSRPDRRRACGPAQAARRVSRQHDRAAANLRRAIRVGDTEREAVRERGSPHARTG
jgi:GAF domain-containing protein